MKYYLIPADFELYDFKNIKKETKGKDGLLWHSQSWHLDENKNWKCTNYNYEVGGIVYFYYKNIPDLSKRILLRGEITAIDKESEWYFGQGKNRIKKKCKCIAINNLKPILLDDVKKYNYDSLINKFGLKTTYRQEIKNEKLVASIEKDYSQNGNIEDVVKHFNKEAYCECCEILERSTPEKEKRTFIKKNGIIYREIHHLLMQNVTRKSDEWFTENDFLDKNVSNWIDEDFNRIRLCPVCHREFHYGDFESKSKNKKQIIEEIMEKNHYEKNLKKYIKQDKKIYFQSI